MVLVQKHLGVVGRGSENLHWGMKRVDEGVVVRGVDWVEVRG